MRLFHRGLSLIEVTIVLSLIGVLMAFSLPMLTQANARARSMICRQNLSDIGDAITAHAMEQGRLPTLLEPHPTQQGMALAQWLGPKLQTPCILMCPSDETQTSQLLGTSYRWQSAFNGMPMDEPDQACNQPLLADREAYHEGSDMPINALTIRVIDGGYTFSVTEPETTGDDHVQGYGN